MCSVAFKVVDKSKLVSITKSITLETFCKAVESSCKHHGAVADLIFLSWQTKGVYFDCAGRETFFIGKIAVLGKVDVLEGANNEANVLGED